MTEPTEVTPETADAQETATSQDVRAEGIKSIEAKLQAAASRGSQTEEPAESTTEAAAEPEAVEDERPTQYTTKEVAAYVKENPKWFDTLDKTGWAKVPEDIAEIYKVQQGQFTRTVQQIKAQAQPKPEAEPRPAVKAPSAEEKAREIFDDEAIEAMKAIYREELNAALPPEERAQQKREKALNDGWDAAEVEAPYLKNDDVRAEMQEVLVQRPKLQDLLLSGDKEAVSFALVTAGEIAKARVDLKTVEQRSTKAEKLEKAKADQAKRLVNAQAGKPPLSVTAGAKGGSVDPDSRKTRIEERYAAVLAKQSR